MRQFELLRRKLNEQHQLKIELRETTSGPDDNPPDGASAGRDSKSRSGKERGNKEPAVKGKKKKRFFAIGGLITVIAIILGACLY
jgi:hypothetical protein